MSAELSLLLTAVANQRPAADNIDWQLLQDLSDHHRLTPLLLPALRAHGVSVPAAALGRLQASVRATARQNLLLFAHTHRICTQLQDSGIDCWL